MKQAFSALSGVLLRNSYYFYEISYDFLAELGLAMYIDKGDQPESRHFSVNVCSSIDKHVHKYSPGNQVPFNQCIQLYILIVCAFLAELSVPYDLLAVYHW